MTSKGARNIEKERGGMADLVEVLVFPFLFLFF